MKDPLNPRNYGVTSESLHNSGIWNCQLEEWKSFGFTEPQSKSVWRWKEVTTLYPFFCYTLTSTSTGESEKCPYSVYRPVIWESVGQHLESSQSVLTKQIDWEECTRIHYKKYCSQALNGLIILKGCGEECFWVKFLVRESKRIRGGPFYFSSNRIRLIQHEGKIVSSPIYASTTHPSIYNLPTKKKRHCLTVHP